MVRMNKVLFHLHKEYGQGGYYLRVGVYVPMIRNSGVSNIVIAID